MTGEKRQRYQSALAVFSSDLTTTASPARTNPTFTVTSSLCECRSAGKLNFKAGHENIEMTMKYCKNRKPEDADEKKMEEGL